MQSGNRCRAMLGARRVAAMRARQRGGTTLNTTIERRGAARASSHAMHTLKHCKSNRVASYARRSSLSRHDRMPPPLPSADVQHSMVQGLVSPQPTGEMESTNGEV